MHLKLKTTLTGYLQRIIKMPSKLNKELEGYFLLSVLMKSYQKNYQQNTTNILKMKLK